MAETHVISALVKRCADLMGEIEHTQLHARKLIADLEHLDQTIRQFDPDYQLQEIKPKGFRPPSDWAQRGEMSHAVLNMLRLAKDPMTTQEIAKEIMKTKGLNIADAKLLRKMTKRTSVALRAQRDNGLVRYYVASTPKLTFREASMVASIAGKLEGGKLSCRRSFREPHHSSSMAAMVGGGKRALPGEISLAHHGVLFLDELPEFPRAVLESLRQPLETGRITVARASAHVTYPARFQLVAAMNPCRCGYLDDASRACNKAPKCAVEYQSKISGLLFDRFDIVIDVPDVPTLDMLNFSAGESSAAVAARVAEARDRQGARFARLDLPYRLNAQMQGESLHQQVLPDDKGRKLLEQATEKLKLSMRGYTRVLRVARTIADLAGSDAVTHTHIGEALSYRQMQFGKLEAA